MLPARRFAAFAAGLGGAAIVHVTWTVRGFTERVDDRLVPASTSEASSALARHIGSTAGVVVVSGSSAATTAMAAIGEISPVDNACMQIAADEHLEQTVAALLAPTLMTAKATQLALLAGFQPTPLAQLLSGPRRLVLCLHQRHLEDSAVVQWIKEQAIPVGSKVILIADRTLYAAECCEQLLNTEDGCGVTQWRTSLPVDNAAQETHVRRHLRMDATGIYWSHTILVRWFGCLGRRPRIL